jgi:hypothetical protein
LCSSPGFPGWARDAHRFLRAYPGGIFWFDARGDWQAFLQNIVGTAKLAASNATSAGQNGELKSFLAGRGPYLWVLDGIPPAQTREALEDRLAPTTNGRTLITTISTKWSSVGSTLGVEALDREAALVLLTRYNPALMAQAEAHQLLDELGGHPLALDMLAALAQDTNTASRSL